PGLELAALEPGRDRPVDHLAEHPRLGHRPQGVDGRPEHGDDERPGVQGDLAADHPQAAPEQASLGNGGGGGAHPAMVPEPSGGKEPSFVSTAAAVLIPVWKRSRSRFSLGAGLAWSGLPRGIPKVGSPSTPVNTCSGRLPPSTGTSSGSAPWAAAMPARTGPLEGESIGVRDGSIEPWRTSSTPGAWAVTGGSRFSLASARPRAGA